MKVQIKRFSTHQTAKVFSILMALTSLLFMLPFALISMLAIDGQQGFGGFGLLFFMMPIFQGVFAYLFMRLGLWLYNKISPRSGGIEFELAELDP